MPGKKDSGFRCRLLLAMLFLFFNCVCIAAPVIKIAAEDAVAGRLAPIPKTTETEEGNHLTASSYVNQQNHFSVRRQSDRRVSNTVNSFSAASFRSVDLRENYIAAASLLPTPGYYCFLFRYNLF